MPTHTATAWIHSPEMDGLHHSCHRLLLPSKAATAGGGGEGRNRVTEGEEGKQAHKLRSLDAGPNLEEPNDPAGLGQP